MRTIEKILIGRGEIERIYRGRASLALWRAYRKDEVVRNPLYPTIEKKQIRPNEYRDPDIVTKPTRFGRFVVAQVRQGTSLMDVPNGFGTMEWAYVVLPAGVEIPPELIITKDHFMKKQGCFHYTVGPNFSMKLDRFLAALDLLAFNANIKLVKDLAHG